MRAALRRQAAIALGVWAISLFTLAAAYALPGGPQAALAVDDASPYVGQTVHFDASASTGHDAGQGRIVAYSFTFGDGAGTGWQSSSAAAHGYGQEGVVIATVTVKDARGAQAQASLALQVRPPPPPSGNVPDLIPIRATFSPERPEANTTVVLAVTLINRGGMEAVSARIDVTDLEPNGTAVVLESSDVAQPVPPGATVTVTRSPYRVTAVGNHTFTIVVANVTPEEPAPTDNVLQVVLTVVPPGTPTNAVGFSMNPLALGFAVAGIVAVAVAALLLRRPRPPGPSQPPPPEPQDRSPPPIWPP